MSTKWVAFNATVPEWAVPALSQHVADVAARAAADEEGSAKPLDQRVGEALTLIRTLDGWALIKALTHLSTQSRDGWVEWSALCETMNMEPRKLSGVLGAMERSLKGAQPLYERRVVSSKSQFRMNRDIAKIILDTVAESTDESLNTDDSNLFL